MAPADRAADLVSVLERDHTALEVLSLLAHGDVARLPDLAAAVIDGDDLVLLVRGPYRIAYGESQWSGEDTATWREHRVAVAAGDELLVERDGVAHDGLRLPVRCGVVLGGQVTWAPDLEAEPVAGQGSTAGAPESPVETAAGAVDDVSGAEPPDAEPSNDAVAPASADPEATRVEVDDDFDAMFGATVQGRRVQDAAMHSSGPAAERGGDAAPVAVDATVSGPVQQAPTAAGDHDGRTITARDLQRLREQRSTTSRDAGPAPDVARPPAATLTISTGEAVALDRPVIIGRSPRATQMSSSALPHVVVVDDPYVSSTHLEVSFRGTSFVAIDRSTNGTTLTCPGQATERLAKGEPRVLVDGCVLGLSDELTATIAFHGEHQ